MVQKNKKPLSQANTGVAERTLKARPVHAATSLDDLSAATGMNRPSLYGAFGDKRELYIKAYQRYRADAAAAMIDIFKHTHPIRPRLQRIYAVALDISLSWDAAQRD